MDAEKRKQMKADYKDKRMVGAVYEIVCSGNGRRYLHSTMDVEGIRNRFRFAMMTKGCPEPALKNEFDQYGADSFSLVILEELKMQNDQTAAAFREDIRLLYKMWKEKVAE